MHVTAYKTPIITAQDNLQQIIAKAIPSIPEKSFLVVASKIFSTVENRFVPKTTTDPNDKSEKHELVKQEAEWYTDPTSSKYDVMLTIKRNWIFANAGIDESNANDDYILWPEDPQKSINELWRWACEHYQVKELGLIMTDSASIPLNWGVVGHGIAFCGFNPLKSYIGKPDLFGRLLKMEQVSILQSVATAAVLEMGEGNESTPLAVVEGVQEVEFHDHVPTDQELAALKIELEDDVFAPILTRAPWERGQAGR
jgi:dihydrofolate synthase / folylpolyglutamate synthase